MNQTLKPLAEVLKQVYPNYHPEVGLEEVGAPALSPFFTACSSSRLQMFSSHLTQHLWFKGVEPPRCLTGIEREFAQTTFALKIPVDATILAVIPRYPMIAGADSIRENPEYVVIYENFDTKEVGCLVLPRHHSIHKDFGFRYVPENYDLIAPKQSIKKGTRFGRSPEVDELGNYCYGGEFNVAFMSIPQIAEDGIVISESAASRLTTKAFGTRVIKWGKKHFPLNIYSNDPRIYKPFPDIGDLIRSDGLLFGLRTHDNSLAPVEMLPEALMELDQIYDKPVYAEPGARVIDVKVWCERTGKPLTPIGMETQADKYANAAHLFYERILAEYNKLRKHWGENLRITPEFHDLVVKAIADQGLPGQNERVTKTYRMQPLDEYRVEITYEYELKANIGFKISGRYGDGSKITGRYGFNAKTDFLLLDSSV